MTLDDVVILSDQQVKGIYYDVYNGFWKRYSKAVPSWQAVYQYTAAQIEEIKRQAVQEQKQYLDKVIDEEWKKRTEAVSGETEEERMKKVLGLLLSVPARILCEKFHWKEVRDENDHRSKLLQFSEAVVKEVNRICDDENADIRKYCKETYEKYGVRYEVKDDKQNGR